MANNLDRDTLIELIRIIDKIPAVTWIGNGGVKSRIQQFIAENEPGQD